MILIWVNCTSSMGESGISWGSETVKDTPVLNLGFPDGKWNVLIFLSLPCTTPSPPDLVVALDLTMVDYLLSQTKHAAVQLCYLLAALSVQGKLCSLFFYSTSFLLHLQKAWAWLLTFLWTVYKKMNSSHPSSIGHWNTLSAFLLKKPVCIFPLYLICKADLQTSYSSCCMNEWRK